MADINYHYFMIAGEDMQKQEWLMMKPIEEIYALVATFQRAMEEKIKAQDQSGVSSGRKLTSSGRT